MSSLQNNLGFTGLSTLPVTTPSPGTAQSMVTEVLNTQAAAAQANAQSASSLSNIVGLLSVMMSAVSQTTRPPTPAPAPAAAPRSAGSAAGAAGRQLKIVELDDFSVAHGNEIAKTLTRDGDVDLERVDLSRGGGNRLASMSTALDNLIERARNGETIDAVNISQQDFGNSGLAGEVRRKIDLLSDLGVPVAVAAGNNGPNQKNSLTGTKSFNVMSTTNGTVNRTSGTGNVSAEGQTTSFATANLAVQLARLRAQGLSNGQILNTLA